MRFGMERVMPACLREVVDKKQTVSQVGQAERRIGRREFFVSDDRRWCKRLSGSQLVEALNKFIGVIGKLIQIAALDNCR